MGAPFHGHLTAPIRTSDEEIAAALEGANVLALVASVVHMSHDPTILHGPIRPHRFVFNEFDGGLSEEEQTEIRATALKAILRYRDEGSPALRPLGDRLVRELMNWMATEPVPDEYADLFDEEMDLGGDDPRRLSIASPEALSVLIIGCGMSGLLAAVRLKQAGVPFEVIEKNLDVGGTWLENTYPGCRVDVANHYYCYSFEPKPDFTGYFSPQPELLDYFRAVMDGHGITPHVRWATEVKRLVWDEDAQLWRVTMRLPDGRLEEGAAAAVISAVGQLNRPLIPDLPNLQRFAGPVFHSARWDHKVDLQGRRVALVGAGASGFQIGPAIADQVEHLVVVQRTGQWVMPNPLYHERVPPGSIWAMRHLPGYGRWYRFLLLWQATDKMLDIARVDPDWPGMPNSANFRSERFRQRILRWIDDQVGEDPALAAALTPDYPPLGKRLLQDDGTWMRTLARPDVDLVRGGVDDVEADAIVAAGRRFEVDTIILATGFRANEFLFPMEIVGRGGRTLNERWAGRPAAYVGITVPEFPNFFLMYGPGTNLAHAGSVIFQSECQMRYIGGCLSQLAESGGAIEPTEEAYLDYVRRWQKEQEQMVWSHPSVTHSWYKAPDGHVYVLSPWRLVDYWKMTSSPLPECHVLRRPSRSFDG